MDVNEESVSKSFFSKSVVTLYQAVIVNNLILKGTLEPEMSCAFIVKNGNGIEVQLDKETLDTSGTTS